MPGAAQNGSGRPLTVLGAGSWGTALAIHLAGRGHGVRLWSRAPEHREALARERRNRRYLADFELPAAVEIPMDLSAAVAGSHLVVCAIPSHGMRGAMAAVRETIAGLDAAPDADFLIAAKGIEVESLMSMHEVLSRELPSGYGRRVAALGGPSFAVEVAMGLPTTVVVAAEHEDVRVRIQHLISGGSLRAYASDDVVGVELGGALKNVIALAAGMGDGAGLGHNARAGLITRGLAEISRLATALGAHPATLSGLAGLGDLVLTCTGGLSRNRRVGVALGQGKKLDEVVAEMGMVAEGVKNTRAASRLAQREGVEMPIVRTMNAILYEGLTVPAAVDTLMGRALKAERA